MCATSTNRAATLRWLASISTKRAANSNTTRQVLRNIVERGGCTSAKARGDGVSEETTKIIQGLLNYVEIWDPYLGKLP